MKTCCRMLAINHDPVQVDAIMEHAFERGHVCGGVTDPRCVLTIARELRPDVIVCSLGFDRSGGDVLSNFEADPLLCMVPVIMLVGAGDHPLDQRRVTRGPHLFLPQPVTAADLFSHIERLLDPVRAFTVGRGWAQRGSGTSH